MAAQNKYYGTDNLLKEVSRFGDQLSYTRDYLKNYSQNFVNEWGILPEGADSLLYKSVTTVPTILGTDLKSGDPEFNLPE